MVIGSMILTAVFQLGGVASVLPFLSVAAHPEGFAASGLGKFLVSMFHITDNRQLVYLTGALAILSLVLASGSTIVSQVIVGALCWGHWALATHAAPFQVLQPTVPVLCLSQLCGPYEEGEHGYRYVH